VFYETARNDHGLPHDPFKSCVVPRPIGWITTIDNAGVLNLAPFSYFNACGDHPPQVMYAPSGSHAEGGAKDSLQNVQETGEFVASLATWEQREAMRLLAVDAGERLLALSSGRYRLVVQDEAFWVVDRLNGDERRSVKTLSGGETFLASLALALALSERLPEIAGRGGAMSLESLFLDEGFGALDQDSLDTAIGGLELLAGGQRLVGVISHIPEVAERLPDRVEVVRNGATSRLVTSGAIAEAGSEPALAASP
jgi:exonuclease SbcC